MQRVLSLVLAFFTLTAFAQEPYQWVERKSIDGRFTYKTVQNDPLGVRIYTLQNGLTVMISVKRDLLWQKWRLNELKGPSL